MLLSETAILNFKLVDKDYKKLIEKELHPSVVIKGYKNRWLKHRTKSNHSLYTPGAYPVLRPNLNCKRWLHDRLQDAVNFYSVIVKHAARAFSIETRIPDGHQASVTPLTFTQPVTRHRVLTRAISAQFAR